MSGGALSFNGCLHLMLTRLVLRVSSRIPKSFSLISLLSFTLKLLPFTLPSSFASLLSSLFLLPYPLDKGTRSIISLFEHHYGNARHCYWWRWLAVNLHPITAAPHHCWPTDEGRWEATQAHPSLSLPTPSVSFSCAHSPPTHALLFL